MRLCFRLRSFWWSWRRVKQIWTRFLRPAQNETRKSQKTRRQQPTEERNLRRCLLRNNLDPSPLVLKFQRPVAWRGMAVDLRRLELPVTRSLKRFAGEITARPRRGKRSVGDVSVFIHRQPHRNFDLS